MSNREPNEFIILEETPPRASRVPPSQNVPFRTPTNRPTTNQIPFTPPETPPSTPNHHSTPIIPSTPDAGRTIKSFNLKYKTLLLTEWMVTVAYSTGQR